MNIKHNIMKVYGSERKLILKVPLSKNKIFKFGIHIGESHFFPTIMED